MKVGIVDHGIIGTTFIPPKPVSVSLIDDSGRNIEVTGDLLKRSIYNLTAQLSLTRQERRKQQRKLKK